jgi:DNA-binding response OmpR family regulator
LALLDQKAEPAKLSVQLDLSQLGPILIVVPSEHCEEKNVSHILQVAGYRIVIASVGPNIASSEAELALLIGFKPASRIERIVSATRRDVPDLPVIVLGPDDFETKVRLLELRADDYIVEPFDSAELLARIGSLIRRRNFSRCLPIASHTIP